MISFLKQDNFFNKYQLFYKCNLKNLIEMGSISSLLYAASLTSLLCHVCKSALLHIGESSGVSNANATSQAASNQVTTYLVYRR